MFRAAYGFSCNPFSKSLPTDAAFLSRDHKQMLSRLNFLKDTRGIGIFTAEPGMGKSFALRCFANAMNPNLFSLAYICLTTVSVSDFYCQLCNALKVESSVKKSVMFKAIQERVFFLFKEKRMPFFLFIDEAHELSPGILRDIRMLLNHDFDSCDCFSIVLAGEPHLNHLLERAVFDALRQRIIIHYNFEGLSPDEVEAYLSHKFHLANASFSILSDGVVAAVAGHSGGNPRLIDRIMFDALNLGAQNGDSTITTDTILNVVNNLHLS
jgi:type II secretory pathway predicted ATPase ExeA